MSYKTLTAEKVKGTTARCLRIDKDYICTTYDVITEEKYEMVDMLLNRLAELEDKIEQGEMIQLPCKVGDTVYSNERIMFEPLTVKVITTHQSINLPVSYTVFGTAKDGYGLYLSSDNFNEDWFLTKAEAEKKLKELQNEKDR